jgi:hypothetical protein
MNDYKKNMRLMDLIGGAHEEKPVVFNLVGLWQALAGITVFCAMLFLADRITGRIWPWLQE